MRYGYWLPVFGGWLRNVDDEGMAASWDYVRRLAQRSEEIGYDLTLIAELLLNDIKGIKAPSLDAWSTAAALAAVTERLELMVAVRPSFHPPAILAKQAANIDRISNGRLALNVVSAWWKDEARRFGAAFDEHDDRYGRTREWLDVVDGAWREPAFSYHGKFYNHDDIVLEPKPASKPGRPRPTIYAGGESEAAKTLIARQCDAYVMHGDPPERIAPKIADMRARREQASEALGIDLPPMQFGVAAYTIVRDSETEVQRRDRPHHQRRGGIARLRELPRLDREHEARAAGHASGLLGFQPRSPGGTCRHAGAGCRANGAVRRGRGGFAAPPVQPAARGDGAFRRRGDLGPGLTGRSL